MMKKTLRLAWLAGITLAMAACAHNGSSVLPSTAAAPQPGAAFGANAAAAPQGWAATKTQAVRVAFGSRKSSANRVPESVPMRIVVGLAMRDPGGAAQRVREQFTPGMAAFHTFMTPAQFTAEFNPTYSQANEVANYLRANGFKNVSIEPNHLIVSGTASASRVESTFHTTIRASRANGQLLYANVTPALVPSKFKGLVIAVLGLNNVYHMSTHLMKQTRPFTPLTMRPSAAGTPPPFCIVTPTGVCTFGEYSPPQYQVAYNANCTGCSTGSNTAVAVMAEGNVSQVVNDLRQAEAFWALPKVAYAVKKVGVSSTDTSGLDEWDLDTQISSGIAQTVKELYVYDTTSLSDSDIALEYSHWVNDNLTKAGNSSFGENESYAFADGAMALDDEEFNQAAAQGMTMFASTGDNGEGCPVVAATGVPNTGVPEVCYPATSPYVVAVGGTTLDTNAVGSEPGSYYGEHVWVGTGGGFSKYEGAPYWQTNGICAACLSIALRGIADIAMCADNNGCPLDVFVNGVQTGVGGTSLSSPMSMGIWARLQTHWLNNLGFAAPVYYGVYATYEPCPLGSTGCTPAGEPGDDTAALPPDTTAPIGGFHDILYGSNGIPSSATPGWDTPTGLGSINYRAMQSDIGHSAFSGH
jgi:pseudomonalisin/xanthomonalisin